MYNDPWMQNKSNQINMDNRNNVAPSVESGNAQAPHHINVRNSLSDCVWTEVRKKRNRSTNLQNHTPRRSKHIKEHLLPVTFR
jgi:hypothetical protein